MGHVFRPILGIYLTFIFPERHVRHRILASSDGLVNGLFYLPWGNDAVCLIKGTLGLRKSITSVSEILS